MLKFTWPTLILNRRQAKWWNVNKFKQLFMRILVFFCHLIVFVVFDVRVLDKAGQNRGRTTTKPHKAAHLRPRTPATQNEKNEKIYEMND